MKCHDCAVDLKKKHGTYTINTREVSRVDVPNVTWLECGECHARYLPAGESTKINNFVKSEIDKRISDLPIRQFITTNEAIQLLDITKQAFTKNSRIKRGFIYSYAIDGRRLYVKKSVEAYAKSRDGRFPLVSPPLLLNSSQHALNRTLLTLRRHFEETQKRDLVALNPDQLFSPCQSNNLSIRKHENQWRD